MTADTSENPFRPRVRGSNKDWVDDMIREEEAEIEGAAPSSDFAKTNQDPGLVNAEARKIVAQKLMLEREKDRASRDKLTGLRNRRWFDGKLDELQSQADNSPDSNLWLIMFDIDKFGDFNKSYGHPGGDKVLGLLQKVFRKTEFAARYGGEEIALLADLNDIRTEIPLSDEEKVKAITDRVSTTMRLLSRGTMAELTPIEGAPTDGIRKEVTLSYGASKYVPLENREAVKTRASAGILKAKQEGRDRGFITKPKGEGINYQPIQQIAA